ncbi:MAG: argB, partial [Acidobacteria bacterium]|nr:argB [Acidobacteriota bacterium]
LSAESLRFITDVAGLLDANGDVVPQLHAHDVASWIASDAVTGGMRPKLEAALGALRSGVPVITIGEEGGTNLLRSEARRDSTNVAA